MCGTDADTTSLADEYEDLGRLFTDADRTPREVVRSVFDLKQAEVRVYFVLVEHRASTASQLAEILDRHYRHVARLLRGLHDTGLVKREEQVFDSGGKGYIYDPVPVDEAQQYLEDQLEEWVVYVRSEIEQFDSKIEAKSCSDGEN